MGPGGVDEAQALSLLELVRAGDRGALDALFGLHRNYLLHAIELRMGHNLRARIDPSDVVQEAQLEAARRIDDYLDRRPMPFHIWLRQTAYENLLRLRRQHVEADCRTVGRETPLPEHSSGMLALKILSQEPNPGQRAIEEELARRLREAISQLPEVDAEILLMRNVEGLTNQEAAQVLDMDTSAASKRYGRALLKLRQILIDSGISESKI